MKHSKELVNKLVKETLEQKYTNASASWSDLIDELSKDIKKPIVLDDAGNYNVCECEPYHISIRPIIHGICDVQAFKDYKYEGLMLRADEPYKGKRSKDLLKFKEFQDAEYSVIEVEMGPFRYVKNGRECEEEMLSCVTIEHKGYKVRVGSGFDIEQRQHFYQNPQDILGKIIRVNYFEETKNQDGTTSLRFPTLAYIYGDKRDI